MSITNEINRRIAEGRLFRLEPSIPGDPEIRTVLVSVEMNDLLIGRWQTETMRRRCGRLRADLESFVIGERVTVCWEPFQARNAKIGRLHPIEDEVWDLRSQDPKLELRVFFRFALRDVLVALTCSPRSVEVPWLRRAPLKDRASSEWKSALVECKAEWNKLFPAHDPHSGDDIHGYISSNVVLV